MSKVQKSVAGSYELVREAVAEDLDFMKSAIPGTLEGRIDAELLGDMLEELEADSLEGLSDYLTGDHDLVVTAGEVVDSITTVQDLEIACAGIDAIVELNRRVEL